MGSLDPDPDCESGYGSRKAIMTHKNFKKGNKFQEVEVLDVLF
jgi:hypothetical protein